MTIFSNRKGKLRTTKEGKTVASAKDRLIDALFRLLTIKEFNDISVSELTIAADVHRSSFYANYDNLFDLLKDSKKEAERRFLEEYPKGLPSDELIDYAHIIPFLRFVKNNENWYRAYKKNGFLFNSEYDMERIIFNVAIPQSKTSGENTAIAYAARFYLGGIDAVIENWMNSGYQESEEEIASIIDRLSPRNLIES